MGRFRHHLAHLVERVQGKDCRGPARSAAWRIEQPLILPPDFSPVANR